MPPKGRGSDQEGTEHGALHRSPGTAFSRPRSDDGHDRLLELREAAALLGLKASTLYPWAYKRRIPVVKLFGPRGALRFRLSDVEKLIQDSLRPAIRPLPPHD